MSFSETPTVTTLSIFQERLDDDVLRRRVSLSGPPLLRSAVAARGRVAAWRVDDDGRTIACMSVEGEVRDLSLACARGETAGAVWATESFVAFAIHHDGGVGVHLFRTSGVAHGVLRLDGACSASLRFQGEHLVVADDRGRILVLLTREMRVVREQRVS